VVVPTFDRPEKLLRALRSVYAQTYSHWTLYVVGDHCPTLGGFMQEHAAEFKDRVLWWNLAQQYGNAGFAGRNYALKGMVASDWIAYLDDDNTWTPDHLESLVALLQQEQLQYVFSSFTIAGLTILCEEPKLVPKGWMDVCPFVYSCP
jgi:glycosyltransferase involved in cell wall biosynthesis